MSQNTKSCLIIAASTILTIMLAFCIAISIHLKNYELFRNMILVGIIISVVIVYISIENLISNIKFEKNKKKSREDNIKNYYQYQQLLNPPEIDN